MTKRTLSVLSVATLMAAMVVVTALPAFAASSATSIVYFPFGNGATYSCSGGPPFVSNDSDGSPGNCAIEQIGAPPVGLVCDIPTTITFVHETHQATLDARLCR
jgi:hypothetical protein